MFTLPVGWVQYKTGLRRKVERVDAACDVIGSFLLERDQVRRHCVNLGRQVPNLVFDIRHWPWLLRDLSPRMTHSSTVFYME